MVESLFLPDQRADLFPGRGEAAGDDAVGVRVYRFAAVEADGDVGDADGGGVAGAGADLDFAFYPGLGEREAEFWSATLRQGHNLNNHVSLGARIWGVR